MARYSVEDAQGKVVNVIEWDGVTPFNPGPGLTLVPDFEGKKQPEIDPERAPSGDIVEDRLARMEATLDRIDKRDRP